MQTIAVFGSATAGRDTTHGRLAGEVGELLARRGAALVCGGLGGVMEQACRGARSNGGLTIGILPGAERRTANPYVSIALPTGMGEARNLAVALSCPAAIAIGGSHGTLSEICFALKHGVRVIGLFTWPEIDGVRYVETAAAAVELALA